jgi:hypothetical protein
MDRQPAPDAVETFLVERYWPGIDAATLPAVLRRLDAAAEAMTAEVVSGDWWHEGRAVAGSLRLP